MDIKKILIENLHTTTMGAERVRKNIAIPEAVDVIVWAQKVIRDTPFEFIQRRGKNWYVYNKESILTINGHSYTLITAHKEK